MRGVRRTHTWNIEVQAFRINAMFAHDLRYEALAIGVMDKLGFQSAEYRCDLLRCFPLMDRPRVVRRKRFFQHFASEIDQGACSVGWRKDEDVSGIEPGTSLLVRNFRIEKNRTHGLLLTLRARQLRPALGPTKGNSALTTIQTATCRNILDQRACLPTGSQSCRSK